jgi:hypothetical protein
VVWCGVVWCGVVWCGVVWCGVVWCGVLCAGVGVGLGVDVGVGLGVRAEGVSLKRERVWLWGPVDVSGVVSVPATRWSSNAPREVRLESTFERHHYSKKRNGELQPTSITPV